jgi:hypothetical protein
VVGDVRPFVLTADICLVYKCTKNGEGVMKYRERDKNREKCRAGEKESAE